jgi:predicted cupin superfamily sugar epimerase
MTKPEDLIKKLNMIAHPEGGYFSESFRDDNNNVSLIYYLLQKNEWSHWHRLTKNETLHFYKGDPLIIYISKDGIDYSSITIGEDDNFHYTVESQNWFAMKSSGAYSLIGCTVAPGFDYKDFELAPADWKPTNFNIS